MTHLTDALAAKLGYRFQDESLLKRALTHAGANSAQSNERLEFLGDRVLGLIIAEKLHALFPDDAEWRRVIEFAHRALNDLKVENG